MLAGPYLVFKNHSLQCLKVRKLKNIKYDYDERFFLMWKYYLLSCAGIFRARIKQLWQIVFSKNGVKWGYQYQR